MLHLPLTNLYYADANKVPVEYDIKETVPCGQLFYSQYWIVVVNILVLGH